jgi:uncharacterized membrane protein
MNVARDTRASGADERQHLIALGILAVAGLLVAAHSEISDTVLVRSEELARSHPFEYPALARVLYLGERAVSGSQLGIALVNAVLMIALALVVREVLRAGGADVAIWSTAPILVLAGQNWDVLTVLFIALALVAWRRGEDTRAGLWLGLGTAFKLVPGVLLVPMLAADRRRGARTTIVAVATVVVANAPLVLRNASAWWYPYHFASVRTDTRGTVWAALPLSRSAVNALSSAVLVAGLLAVFVVVARRRLSFERGAVLAVLAFVAANKVWQPHYVLWLLPVVALAAVDRRAIQPAQWVSLAWFVLLWSSAAWTTSGPALWLAGTAWLGALAVLVAVTLRGPIGAPVRARATAGVAPPAT